jgi:hypothetical protein
LSGPAGQLERVSFSFSRSRMQNQRRRLTSNEQALLEVAALQPISIIPQMHRSLAERLAEQGLLRRQGELWVPTVDGLAITNRAPH